MALMRIAVSPTKARSWMRGVGFDEREQLAVGHVGLERDVDLLAADGLVDASCELVEAAAGLGADRDGVRDAASARTGRLPRLRRCRSCSAAGSRACPSAPISSSTSWTLLNCCSACGWPTSSTCRSRSACTASSSVALKLATRLCGRSRTKPTVSLSRTSVAALELPGAGLGVERGEELVVGVRAGGGERVEQRALAGVGVADEQTVKCSRLRCGDQRGSCGPGSCRCRP